MPTTTMPVPVAPASATQPFVLPPPITADEISAMTKDQARSALYQRAVVERHLSDYETRERVTRERRMLIDYLKGKAPTSQPSTIPAAASSPHTPTDLPPALTFEQIESMTKAEARAALYKCAIAEKNVNDPALKERLTIERRLLVERLKRRDL